MLLIARCGRLLVIVSRLNAVRFVLLVLELELLVIGVVCRPNSRRIDGYVFVLFRLRRNTLIFSSKKIGVRWIKHEKYRKRTRERRIETE